MKKSNHMIKVLMAIPIQDWKRAAYIDPGREVYVSAVLFGMHEDVLQQLGKTERGLVLERDGHLYVPCSPIESPNFSIVPDSPWGQMRLLWRILKVLIERELTRELH